MTSKVSPYPSSMQTAPAQDCIAITALTASASNFAYVGRGIYVGSTGDVQITTPSGNQVTFKNCPTGLIIPALFVRVDSSETTASELIGFI